VSAALVDLQWGDNGCHLRLREGLDWHWTCVKDCWKWWPRADWRL